MQIDRRTLIYSAVQQVKCSKVQALAYYSRLTEINFDRADEGMYLHSVECIWDSDGMLIAGKDFHVDALANDLCQAIAELLAVAGVDHLDVTYCVCTPTFHSGSHWGGCARIYRNGQIKQTRFFDASPHQ